MSVSDPKEQSYSHSGGCPHPKDKLRYIEPEEKQVPSTPIPDVIGVRAKCGQCGDTVVAVYVFQGVR